MTLAAAWSARPGRRSWLTAPPSVNIAALMLRLVVGGTMLAHGWNHAFGGGKLPGFSVHGRRRAAAGHLLAARSVNSSSRSPAAGRRWSISKKGYMILLMSILSPED